MKHSMSILALACLLPWAGAAQAQLINTTGTQTATVPAGVFLVNVVVEGGGGGGGGYNAYDGGVVPAINPGRGGQGRGDVGAHRRSPP